MRAIGVVRLLLVLVMGISWFALANHCALAVAVAHPESDYILTNQATQVLIKTRLLGPGESNSNHVRCANGGRTVRLHLHVPGPLHERNGGEIMHPDAVRPI